MNGTAYKLANKEVERRRNRKENIGAQLATAWHETAERLS